MPSHNRFKGIAVTAAVWAVSSLFVSCKENTIIPSNVVPAVDNIRVFADTLDLYTKTVLDDTLITSLYVSGVPVYMGAGTISDDPLIGKLQESFYFQVRPPQDNYTFDQAKFQIDSAVIVLPYSGFSYGDTTNSAGMQTFEAYRVTDPIFRKDSAYYSNRADFGTEGTTIGETTVSLRDIVRSRYDSTRVGSAKRAPHLRIKLHDDMRDKLIERTGTSDYTNTTAFLSFFNGIKIVAKDNTKNMLPYFLLNGPEFYSTASIVMYYHTRNSGGTITDTLTASYPFDADKCGFFNKIVRDFSGKPAEALYRSAAATDNMFLVTNQPGLAGEIRVVNFEHIPTCIVNKAELILTQVSAPMNQVFAPPTRIYPKGVNTDGSTYVIADRFPTSSLNALAFIDGNLRSANLGGVIVNQYVLNIPRELERAIADKKKEVRLRLNGTQSFPGAYRLAAGGSNYSLPQYQASLKIVYTKL